MEIFTDNNLELLYKALLEHSDFGILISDENGKIIEINKKALEILGSPSKQLTMQINLLEFTPLIEMGFSGDLFDTMDKYMDKLGKNNYTSKWGKSIYLGYKMYPIQVGSKTYAKIILEDLTEVKKQEKKLKRYEKILINTFNSLEDLIIVIDKNFDIITSTWENARLLNAIGEENKCYTTFFGSDSICRNCKVKKVFETKTKIEYEKSDNQTNFFEIKLIPLFDSNGEVEAVIEHYHDISKIRKNEIRLQKLETAFNNADETIVITDENANIEYANPAFTKITGYSLEEAIGVNPRILKSGIHSKKFYQELWDIISSGKTWRGEFTNKKKDGSLYQEAASISPIFNKKGKIINYIAVKRDITNEIKLQKQLIESQKLESIGILASGIAHEINTPLQYIMDNLSFIADSFEELKNYKNRAANGENISEEVRIYQQEIAIEIPEALKDSLKGVKIIKNIVNSMRTFSYKSKNKQIVENINKHIIATTEISKNYWKNILELKLNLSDSLPKIKANTSKLNQVFLNLIINAIDAIKDDKNKNKKENKLTISSYVKNNKLIISFEDTGIGINEENKDKIFAPFFTTKEIGKGTGQGLSISYNIIVNVHKGNMYFKSEKYKGTTFFIELPLDLE